MFVPELKTTVTNNAETDNAVKVSVKEKSLYHKISEQLNNLEKKNYTNYSPNKRK